MVFEHNGIKIEVTERSSENPQGGKKRKGNAIVLKCPISHNIYMPIKM